MTEIAIDIPMSHINCSYTGVLMSDKANV